MTKFAISDIHGCLKSFQALLERIQFSKGDELFLLGDFIDRGPDSKGVIDYIWKLQNEGFNIKCLRGNHEQMLLSDLTADNDLGYLGERNTLMSFSAKSMHEIPRKYIDWMEALPYYFEVDEYILVHGGLDFSLEDPFSDETQMIWIRYWYEQIDRQWLGNRIIVHGHTPTKLPVIKNSLKELAEIPALNIDCGCCFESFGLEYLCALDLTNGKFSFQPRIDNLIKAFEPPKDKFDYSQIIEKDKPARVLYFDFEGAFVDSEGNPKSGFSSGQLEAALKAADFEFLACVSAWNDIVSNPILQLNSLDDRKNAVYNKVGTLISDKQWFLDKLMLIYDTDKRADFFHLESDWYYLDSFADYFFVPKFGSDLFEKERNNRICKPDLEDDGSAVLEWLEQVASGVSRN